MIGLNHWSCVNFRGAAQVGVVITFNTSILKYLRPILHSHARDASVAFKHKRGLGRYNNEFSVEILTYTSGTYFSDHQHRVDMLKFK